MKKTTAQDNIDKIGELFGEFIEDVFGESPLNEGFRNWNKTTEKIKKGKQK